jgi:hypothetical protein
MAKMIKRLPAGFVIPAQPVLPSKPPVGVDWGHEIKHEGYRILVRRDGPTVQLYSRNANDWTGDWGYRVAYGLFWAFRPAISTGAVPESRGWARRKPDRQSLPASLCGQSDGSR